MARIPTTTQETSRPAYLIRQGAVGPGDYHDDKSSLIKGLGSLIGPVAEIAAEEKVKSAVQDSINRSNADIEGQQKGQAAFEEETRFADPDEDQFDIEARGQAAAVSAFNAAIEGRGSAAITTDPNLTRDFGETNKLIASYQQGRTPAAVFQSRMAARVVNMRARFPHARKEIDKYVSSKLGYDPLARELAIEQKRAEGLVDLEVSKEKDRQKYFADKPWLNHPDRNKADQNRYVWESQEASIKREKAVLELQASRGQSVKQQMSSLGQSIAAGYTQIVTENLMSTIQEAVKSGSSLDLLKSNQHVVQAMAASKQNFLKELNRQGITDVDAYKSAIELFDLQTKHIKDLMKHENFEDINGSIIDAYSTDMGRKLLSQPGQLGGILRATNAFIAAGGKSGPQLKEFIANFMLEASGLTNSDFFEKTMGAINLINGNQVSPPNLMNLMDLAKTDAPLAGIAKVSPPSTQQEANMEVPSIVAGIKAMSTGSIAAPANVDSVMSNVADMTDNYVLTNRKNLDRLGPVLSNPNFVKNVKEAKLGSDKANKAASIVAGSMLNLHDKLRSLDSTTAKPSYTMDEQGKLVLGFKHDSPTSFSDRSGREFAEGTARKALSPVLEEANRHMDAYIAYKELQGVPRKQVIDEMRSVLGNNLGPMPQEGPSAGEEDDDIVRRPDFVDVSSLPADNAEQEFPDVSPSQKETDAWKVRDAMGEVDSIMKTINPDKWDKQAPDLRNQMQKDIEDMLIPFIKKISPFPSSSVERSGTKEDRAIAREQQRLRTVMKEVSDKKVELEESILGHEGLRLFVYDDATGERVPEGQKPKGNLTIGYGHLILPGEDFSEGITEEEAKALFVKDLETAKKEAKGFKAFDTLNPERRNVLIEMVYQMGPSRVKGFKRMHEALEKEDYGVASLEMLNSDWFKKQTPLRALGLAYRMLKG